jgi:carbon-monoxide dehydrogenase large subunit
MDYAIPRAADIPEYILGSTVTPTTVNPLGIKGVGEAGTSARRAGDCQRPCSTPRASGSFISTYR